MCYEPTETGMREERATVIICTDTSQAALSDFLISFLMKTVGSGSGIYLGVRRPPSDWSH